MYEYFPVCAELVQSFCGSYGGGRYSDGRIALIQERPAATSALPSVCLHAGKDKAFSLGSYMADDELRDQDGQIRRTAHAGTTVVFVGGGENSTAMTSDLWDFHFSPSGTQVVEFPASPPGYQDACPTVNTE